MNSESPPDYGLNRDLVRQLTRRSDARGLLQLAWHAGLLSVTGYLVYAGRNHLWLPAALLLHGIVLSFLFCPLHETIHRSAFATPALNSAVSWLCGVLLVLPPEYFRCFHFAHHRFTQDPARDPERGAAGPVTLGTYCWRVSGMPYWGDRLSTTARHALSGSVTEPFVPAELRPAVVREARILWIVYVAVLVVCCAGRIEPLLYWALPALLGQPFLRLFLLAEHTGCPESSSMLENTRSTGSNAVLRAITWCMSYHAEHHAYPAVPFHALGKLHGLIGAQVRIRASGYLALHGELLRHLSRHGARAPRQP